MTTRKLWTVLFLGFLTLPAAIVGEQTKVCPPGQIDVLDWATLDADLRTSKHMAGPGGAVLYTVVWPDKYYWMKTSAGDTWDINLYDDTYIYQWITETGYGTPTNYKRYLHDTNAPWMLRCARPGYPGEYIQIPDTTFAIATNCQESSTNNAGYGIVEFWGPYTAGMPGTGSWRTPIGGDIPNNTPVYVVAWYWGCNASYTDCAKEEYILTQRYGFVEWTFATLQNGAYVLEAIQPFNRLVSGARNPYFPCF